MEAHLAVVVECNSLLNCSIGRIPLVLQLQGLVVCRILNPGCIHESIIHAAPQKMESQGSREGDHCEPGTGARSDSVSEQHQPSRLTVMLLDAHPSLLSTYLQGPLAFSMQDQGRDKGLGDGFIRH